MRPDAQGPGFRLPWAAFSPIYFEVYRSKSLLLVYSTCLTWQVFLTAQPLPSVQGPGIESGLSSAPTPRPVTGFPGPATTLPAQPPAPTSSSPPFWLPVLCASAPGPSLSLPAGFSFSHLCLVPGLNIVQFLLLWDPRTLRMPTANIC